MISIVVSLVTGAIGGLLAGYLVKKISLGEISNALCGIVGGGIGGSVLTAFGFSAGPSGTLTLPAVIGSVASGLVGGGLVLLAVGLIMQLIRKTSS